MDLTGVTQTAINDIGRYFFASYGGEAGALQAANAVSALGAVGGFCAQIQARGMLASGALPADKDALVEVVAKGGGVFYFGNAINACLLEGDRSRPSFWNLAAGAARDAKIGERIKLVEIAQHTAKTIGLDTFGIPRIDPRYGLTEKPFEALFQHCRMLMQRFAELQLPQDQLVIAFGFAAQGFATVAAGEEQVNVAIPLPRVEIVRLYMESAIPMSKIDPNRVPYK